MKPKYVAASIVFLLLPVLSIAQIVLPPKDVTFFIEPVVLSLCPDYTNTKQFLCLQGDLSSLTAQWNANYFDNSERRIGVKCYLNCPNAGNDIENQCAIAQQCSYLGLVGSHSCSITSPTYQFNLLPGVYNNVTCKFYDPDNVDDKGKPLQFVPYPSRIFRPIDYSISASPVSVNLGETFNFPLSVIPLGLIPSQYNFILTELTLPNALSIDRITSTTGTLSYGQVGRFSPQVTYLVSKPSTVRVQVSASNDPIICTIDSDCSYLGDAVCITNKCWEKVDLQLNTGKASLSEYDILGFLQIMLLSAFVLLIFRKM